MLANGWEYRKALRVGFPNESASSRATRECLQRIFQSGRIETLTQPKWKAARLRRERTLSRNWSPIRLDWRPSVVLDGAQCRRGSAKQAKAKQPRPRRAEQKAAAQK